MESDTTIESDTSTESDISKEPKIISKESEFHVPIRCLVMSSRC